MANVIVQTAFYYSVTHDPEAELKESKIFNLTLNLDKNFISEIKPHIPQCVKNVKGLEICQAYAGRMNGDEVIGREVDLYKKNNVR